MFTFALQTGSVVAAVIYLFQLDCYINIVLEMLTFTLTHTLSHQLVSLLLLRYM